MLPTNFQLVINLKTETKIKINKHPIVGGGHYDDRW